MGNADRAAVGDVVVDIRNPHRITMGTVLDSRGGIFTNHVLNVFWHHLGYSNWEQPDDLYVVHTGGREVAVVSPSLD